MKKILFLILLSFILLGAFGLASAQRELEVDYPKLPGTEVAPQTVEGTTLPDYVVYIFNFAVAIVGLMAFVSLTIGGIKWYTSAGDPGKLAAAKNQLFSALLGVIILLLSYMILTTINPQLVIFEVSGLKSVETIPTPPAVSPYHPDLLVRIKVLAQVIDKTAQEIEASGNALSASLDECNCSNSQSDCSFFGLSCQPASCYNDPCPNREEIEDIKEKIINKKEEVFFYQARLEAEKEDLGPELKRLPEEKAGQLEKEIESLIVLIGELSSPSEEIIQSSKECSVEKCSATCQESTCHNDCDEPSGGCHPGQCQGGNPCPKDKLRDIINKVGETNLKISQSAGKIVEILN